MGRETLGAEGMSAEEVADELAGVRAQQALAQLLLGGAAEAEEALVGLLRSKCARCRRCGCPRCRPLTLLLLPSLRAQAFGQGGGGSGGQHPGGGTRGTGHA